MLAEQSHSFTNPLGKVLNREDDGQKRVYPVGIIYFAGGGAQQVAIDKNAAQGS
jgi:hypothetical protein